MYFMFMEYTALFLLILFIHFGSYIKMFNIKSKNNFHTINKNRIDKELKIYLYIHKV